MDTAHHTPRGPPVSVGPPVGFPSGRELPPPPLNRPPSTAGSQMSISSMLGGPTPVTREQMPTHYTSPIGASAQPPMYGNAPHASPRVSSATNEYTSFGRPRTPEQRYEHRRPSRKFCRITTRGISTPIYGRQPDPREQPNWGRPGYEQQRHGLSHRNMTDRNHHILSTAMQASSQDSQFEPPYEERMRRDIHQQQQQQQHAARKRAIEAQARSMQPQPLGYGGPAPPNPQYQPHDSPQRRPIEEAPPMMQQQSQRSLLSVQDNNRRGGRISPIPQAVQGVQVQQPGPAGEPGIKSEFGKVFHGIGSGVGATMSMPSPVAASTAGGLPFSGPRREELDSPSAHNSPIENGGSVVARPLGRRRKLKEEDRGDDDSSTGRQTPNGRGKRTKHAAHRHHHHHRPDALDHVPSPSSQSITPFKSNKGTNGNVSPPDGERSVVPHHHIQRHHHHHHSAGPKVASPMNTIIRMPKYEVKSQAIIDAASSFPRAHLGHEYYQPNLTLFRSNSSDRLPYNRGFASTNRAFPNFEGKVNCTYTIKISRTHLEPQSREEITYRKNLWGTDVYTDDSDIVAACIHQGWFCGKWAPDVDVKLLNLYPSDEGVSVEPELDTFANGPDEFFDRPPARGPMPVRMNRDLHVTVLVLDCLDKYTSKVRFGIKSREWGGNNTTAHDGLSYLIMNIKWVDGVDGMQGGNVAKKNFIHMQHREITMDRQNQEAEQEREMWLEKKMNLNGKRVIDHGNGEDTIMEESHLRGDNGGQQVLSNGEIRGVGMGSWWKETLRDSSRHIDNGEGSTVQKDQAMTGNDPSLSRTIRPDSSLTARNTVGPTAASVNLPGYTAKPEALSTPKIREEESADRNKSDATLDRIHLNIPKVSSTKSPNRESGLPEDASTRESMVLYATIAANPQVMPKDIPKNGNLVVQALEASTHDEAPNKADPAREPSHQISEAETENPAAQNQDGNISLQKSKIAELKELKDLEKIPQIVPVVEIPTAAPETQARAQTLHTSSPVVQAGTAVDADYSASTPANN
ncbi:hypothetical protein DID88_000895 [Monilinia fructigena]|uniref:Uncharacterized protein n=1 Tax=Monilinia fructigena TaxID=38457 RepID=A0A395IYH6_9HELO|nr:hypothetical protein DID88_000895 [Monilinia fructigena]